ncbi:MAG: inosine/xanthosine triphosphatase [Gemmatimonadota bacterium]|jgi:inosine/xanthosine triphosphatase
MTETAENHVAESQPVVQRIVVASRNPAKLRAALGAFQRVFPDRRFDVEGVSVPSGVGHQPMSDEETLLGARNRAEGARRLAPDADFWVGMEGGVEEHPAGLASFAWIVVLSRSQIGQGRSGVFFLPEPVARLVRSGVELGDANDRVFATQGSKLEAGAIGLLTRGALDRVELYEHATVLALVPFVHPELYDESLARR